MNMTSFLMNSFVTPPNLFFFIFMSSLISTSRFMVVSGTTHISSLVHWVHTRTHTHPHTHTYIEQWDAALLGLMVMCFMSVPCCGCVSQTERLTNCSILLNVRVMEAINGSELIAVTHLASCYRVLPFTTWPEDLVLSRCLILDRLLRPWTDEQPPLNCGKWHLAFSSLLPVNFVNTRKLCLLSMLSCSHSSVHVSSHWSETWDAKPVSCCFFSVIVEEEGVRACVWMCLCITVRGG